MNVYGSYMLGELKSVFAYAPCGVGVFAAGTREPVYLNSAYYSMVGYTSQEYKDLISNKDQKLVFPQDKIISEQISHKYTNDGSISGVQYRVIRKDGGVCWINLTMMPAMVDGNDCALCFFENITAEKENFTQMKLVADGIGNSICVFRIKNGKEQLLYANKTFFEMIGVDRDRYMENVHEFNWSFTTERDQIRTREAYLKAIETEQPQELTYRLLRPGKDPIWMERKLSVVRQDEADSYLMVSVSTDITKKKQAELALALEQRRYQLVIDEFKVAVFEWDLQTGTFYSSDGYREYAMSAIAPDIILANKGPQDVFHPDDMPVMQRFFADTKSGAPRVEAILRMKLIDGNYRWCRIVGLFYRDEQERPSRTLGIIIDINEEREKGYMLDSLLNELPGGVAVFKTGEKLECTYSNDRFAKLLGYSREEMEKVLAYDFLESVVDPSDLPVFLQKMKSVIATGDNVNHTFRFLNKNGEQGWVHMTACKLREEDGCPVYYCVFTMPSEETTLFRNAVEDSAGGVLVAERKTHRIIYCNRRIRELYRIDADYPLAGRLISEIIPHGSALLCDEEVSALTQDRFSEFHRPLDNLFFAIRAKALNWNGVDSYILYVSDETQEHQKRIQQEELLNQVPMGIGIYEITGGELIQVYMNDSYFRMIDVPREERKSEINNGFMSYVHPDDQMTVHKVVKAIINGSDKETFNHRIICGDGKFRWFRLDASVAKRERGSIKLYCCYINIEAAVSAQQALEKQYIKEQSQRKMLEKDSLLSIQFNVTQDKLVSYQINQGYIDQFENGTAGGVIRSSIATKIPTEEERRIAADFFNKDKAIVRFQNGVNEFSAEYRRRLNNGRLYWLHNTCRLERDRDSGDLISYTYIHNIDMERKKDLTTESVIDEETDFVMLLNVVSNTVTMFRLKSNYQNFDWKLNNEQSFDTVFNAALLNYVVEEDRAAVYVFFQRENLLERIKNETMVTIIYRQYSLDGSIRRKKARAFYLDKTCEDIVIERRDITDLYEEEQKQKIALQKALDEANAANRAKSEFLSRMSHDLRTPMNVIIGLTSLAMNKTGQNDEIRETLSDISTSSKYLLTLINDCLDLEKITSGKIELHPVKYAYKDFYNSVSAMIGPLCLQKNITFVLQDIGKIIRL